MAVDVLKAFGSKRILVIGDLILDHYVHGEVKRISPEAPVPVLEAKREEYRPGGAANVALNLKALGAEVICMGMIGLDNAGQKLESLLLEAGIDTGYLYRDPARRTSLKTRMSAESQQILRIDYEDSHEIDTDTQESLASLLRGILGDLDGIIIEDYDKGLISPGFLAEILAWAAQRKVPIAVDPKRKNFFQYRGVDIFKPNYLELTGNIGIDPQTEEEFWSAAEELRQDMEIGHLVVTRGAKGLYIFGAGERPKHYPTFAREVYDVTGAGDTVISVLFLAWLVTGDIDIAAILANHGAGVVCGKSGTATVTAAEILASMQEQEEA